MTSEQKIRDAFQAFMREAFQYVPTAWQQTAFLQYVQGREVQIDEAQRRTGKSWFKNYMLMWEAYQAGHAAGRSAENERCALIAKTLQPRGEPDIAREIRATQQADSPTCRLCGKGFAPDEHGSQATARAHDACLAKVPEFDPDTGEV